MQPRPILSLVVLAALVTLGASSAAAATKCDLSFHLEGWSVFYKTAHGGGRVTCSNGQVRNVVIRMTGGGATVGRSELHGRGDFSPVADIRQIYGNYANAEALTMKDGTQLSAASSHGGLGHEAEGVATSGTSAPGSTDKR